MRTQNTANFLKRGKNLPLFKKIMYIIRRGKENAVHRSICMYICSPDRRCSMQLFRKAKVQETGKRIKKEWSERRNNNLSEVFLFGLNKKAYSRGTYGPCL